MTATPKTYLSRKEPFLPFEIKHLALISHLWNVGFHKYKNRWAKRLGKRLGRLLFDVAYHRLRLSGQGKVSVNFGDQARTFRFDARKLHFSRIYGHQVYGLCEPELVVLMNAFLRDDAVFYDVGANWGYFSLYAATLPNYRGPIHAFEPVDATYNDLRDWVQQLGQEERVACQKVAMSDTDGTASIGVVSNDSGLASLARAHDADSEKETVPTARLDSLDLPPPDFIKLDVEGFEYQVLQGALDTLSQNKPMIMFENWISRDDPNHTMQPIEILEDVGYKLFVPMWWIGAPTNALYWTESGNAFPKGPRHMAYVPFVHGTRLSLRDQINFFCCHEDRLSELDRHFDTLPPRDIA